jgi:hypothetical protein
MDIGEGLQRELKYQTPLNIRAVDQQTLDNNQTSEIINGETERLEPHSYIGFQKKTRFRSN